MTQAFQRGVHLVELQVNLDQIAIKKDHKYLYLKMPTTTAQNIFEALYGLQSTVQPFQDFSKPVP